MIVEAEGDIQIHHSGQSVSASIIVDSRMASASLTDMGDYWFVNRVIVPSSLRRQHLGTRLLSAAISRAMTLKTQPVQVTPGGYGTPKKVLDRFYTRCGFKKLEPGLYEWVPEKKEL